VSVDAGHAHRADRTVDDEHSAVVEAVGNVAVVSKTKAFMRARFDPDARYGLRLTFFVLAFLIVALPFGFLFGQVVTAGPLTDIDKSASEQFYKLSEPTWANHLLEVISFVGKPIFLSVVVIVPTLWLVRKKELRVAIFLVVTVVSGALVDTALKAAIGRPRPTVRGGPPEAFGSSFPSGHSMASLITYGAFMLVVLPYLPRALRRPSIFLATLLVLAIGFSRLALGMHFLSDVVAGFLFGSAWLLVAVAAFNVWRRDRHEPQVHVDAEGVEPVEPEARAVADAVA
jgi:membrane-associated phospholipid phosphatase